MTAQEILDQAIRQIQRATIDLEGIRQDPQLSGAQQNIGNPSEFHLREIAKMTEAVTRANNAVEDISKRCSQLEAENSQLRAALADARAANLAA